MRLITPEDGTDVLTFTRALPQVVSGRGVVAVVLPTPPSQPPMAIGIGGPSEIMKVGHPRYLELLRDAVQPYSAIGMSTMEARTSRAQ